MRELNECTAEVFRRSEKRIKERKRTRNRVLTWCIPMGLLITLLSVKILPAMMPAGGDKVLNDSGEELIENAGTEEKYGGTDSVTGKVEMGFVDGVTGKVEFGSVDNFTFTLTWGCYGTSSYDSSNGKLVKTTDATRPGDYITTYLLTDEQKLQIYNLIKDLNITSYPDNYNPHEDSLASDPSMILILSVKTDTIQKTITAADIALTYESENSKGQKFLNVCKAIRDILMETEEWKALPEYEFFYD